MFRAFQSVHSLQKCLFIPTKFGHSYKTIPQVRCASHVKLNKKKRAKRKQHPIKEFHQYNANVARDPVLVDHFDIPEDDVFLEFSVDPFFTETSVLMDDVFHVFDDSEYMAFYKNENDVMDIINQNDRVKEIFGKARIVKGYSDTLMIGERIIHVRKIRGSKKKTGLVRYEIIANEDNLHFDSCGRIGEITIEHNGETWNISSENPHCEIIDAEYREI